MLRVGLVGAGAVAKSHLAALRCLKDLQVVAIYDPIRERAAYLAQPWGAAVCDTYEEVIERSEAVWVCTPPGERRAAAVAAAGAHRHVLLDKPIATTLDDARTIVAAADKCRGRCMMCFSQRFGWWGQKMKELVESGNLGEVISIWSHGLQPDPSHQSWRHDPRFACGFTVESLCHNIDQIRWIAGPITGVYGAVSRTLQELPAFDNTMSAVLHLQRGGNALLHSSWASALHSTFGGIIGTHGTLLTHHAGLRLRTLGMEADRVIEVPPPPEPLPPEPPFPHPGSLTWDLRAPDRYFVECIRDERRPELTMRDGLAALEVSLAILKSSAEQQRVDVEPIPLSA
jgi:predicted dehydrogenase